jgi:uncharacterized membrane protein
MKVAPEGGRFANGGCRDAPSRVRCPTMPVSKATKRIDHIDRLRGIAVVAMFFVHSAGALLAPWARDGNYWKWSMRVSGMVAPVFMFLVGISIALIAFAAQERNLNEADLRRKTVFRGLKIVGLGYGLHLVFGLLGNYAGQWEKILKVDILHCIGLSMAVFALIAWPRGRYNWRALALFVLIPVLGQISFRLPLENFLPGALAGYLSTKPAHTLFPFIPYSSWVVLGLLVGPFFARSVAGKISEKRFWIGVVVMAVAFYAAAKGIKTVYYHYGLQYLGGSEAPTKGLVHLFFYKAANLLVIFFVMGASAPLFKANRFKPLVTFGKSSLFAYCVHLLIIYNVTGPYLRQKLSPSGQVVYALALTGLMYFLVVAWRKWSSAMWFQVLRPAVFGFGERRAKLRQ